MAENLDLQAHIGKLWGIIQGLQAAMPQVLQARAIDPNGGNGQQNAAGQADGTGAAGAGFVLRPRWHIDEPPQDPRQNRLPFSPSRSSSSGAARASPYPGGGGGDGGGEAAVAAPAAMDTAPATAGLAPTPPMPTGVGGAEGPTAPPPAQASPPQGDAPQAA